jgi:hypothetical protein
LTITTTRIPTTPRNLKETDMKTIRNILSILATLGALNSAHASSYAYHMGVAADADLGHSTLGATDFGSGHSASFERNDLRSINLGNDTSASAPNYLRQPMKIQYLASAFSVVDCASSKFNMAAREMSSQADAMEEKAWSGKLTGKDANHRYAPGAREEKTAVGILCGSSVAAFR